MFPIFFSLKSMNRLDVVICWFSLDLIAEKSIKIFFYEIKFGNHKSRTTLSYCPNTYFIAYLNEEHVIWSVRCFGTELLYDFDIVLILIWSPDVGRSFDLLPSTLQLNT